jgi:3-hydroxybutyryl-CoA dehydrogenase
MTLFDKKRTIGVVGAGAMGSGIAQVASAAGHPVVLADTLPDATRKARERISKSLQRDVEKGRRTQEAAAALLDRIQFANAPLGDDLTLYGSCGLIIEAIVEDLAAKQALFRRLEGVIAKETVLATNTSSLSIASIAGACAMPARVIGIHFFNPAPVMPLVEIVPWLGGDPALTPQIFAAIKHWGKTTVIATDTPGFIVNRVARPFYGEALRLLEEGAADAPTIDWAMKELGGFRMGPFELMDFIGNDVNYAVTRSVFEGFFFEPRYRPSITQRRLVESGFLGRKTGRGYYEYGDSATTPTPTRDHDVGLLIFERILAMLINEAVDAVLMRVASPADIDLAMTRGVNYPRGLLAWADELGLARVLGWLERLQADYGEDRYRPSPLLRRMVRDGRSFFD